MDKVTQEFLIESNELLYKLKGRPYYRVKFHFKGRTIHECTRARDAKTARSIEGTLRAELAKGNWGILEKKPAPTRAEFLKKIFCRSPAPALR